uniref:Metalloendopeptidase n=1 Tax=Mola mola TaxID=94237 RepID=A0A3Q3VLZ1_MOLML
MYSVFKIQTKDLHDDIKTMNKGRQNYVKKCLELNSWFFCTFKCSRPAVCGENGPLVIDDIAYANEKERNADPCTTRDCLWAKSSDGKVYVPYVIEYYFSPRKRSIIERGLLSFHDVSCIRFVERTNERDYLSIECYSYLGRIGYSQSVSLDRRGCLYHSTVQHELLHAFDKVNTLNLNTPYDYNSVMQYHSYAFSGNSRPTMEPIPNANVEFGTAKQMSKNDIIRLNTLYNC